MKLVVIESPYAGEVEANVAYAKRCVMDCLQRGESPYASHLFFTQDGVLDDLDPEQRKLGIEAGFAWRDRADVIVFYVDRGISRGMKASFKNIPRTENGVPIQVRALDREVTNDDFAELMS